MAMVSVCLSFVFYGTSSGFYGSSSGDALRSSAEQYAPSVFIHQFLINFIQLHRNCLKLLQTSIWKTEDAMEYDGLTERRNQSCHENGCWSKRKKC